jgi:3-hydroxyisobutyrate dehydrogenase-like beta-hydroxyacid dehydrogenase
MAASTILVSSAGEMGAAVGGRFARTARLRVLVPLSGRSEASVSRARQFGLEDSGPSLAAAIQSADVVLSILPPSRAESFAKQIVDAAPTAKSPDSRPIYVDCNAIQPSTVVRISELVSSKFRFVSGGIIGHAPKPEGGSSHPTIYISSAPENDDALRTFEQLGLKADLRIKVLDGGLTAASALKVKLLYT